MIESSHATFVLYCLILARILFLKNARFPQTVQPRAIELIRPQ